MRMRSVPMMVSGIIVGSLGTAALIGGIVRAEQIQAQVRCDARMDALTCIGVGLAGGIEATPWVALATFGGTLMATGAVLTPIGATPVRADRWREPSLAIGPGSLHLTWRF